MKVLIFKMSSGCAACNQLEKRLEPFFELHPEAKDYVRYVNCDENEEAVEFFKVMGVPCIKVVDKCGRLIMSVTSGYMPSYDYEGDILRQIRHAEDIDRNAGNDIVFDLTTLV